MPRRSKGPHLWLRPARRDADGKITHVATYVVLDRGRQVGTGCTEDELRKAEAFLAQYIGEKHGQGKHDLRAPDRIPVSDVIEMYARDIAPHHTRPAQVAYHLDRLLTFFADKTLADINGPLCREYARQSTTDTMARKDLEYLRAAINHHRKEGLHDRIISVVLPARRPPRERWLEPHEVDLLLETAWNRPKCEHVAKFILVALYTGRRSSVVCGASFVREKGRSWVDLNRGMLFPPERARKTKKRNPTIPLPEELLEHLRAWRRDGQRYVVEWNGHPIVRLEKTMRLIAEEAGLGYVTPHVLRHTAATWMMMAGVDIYEAGQYLGMTTRTLEENYAHFRPDHLSSARNAFTRIRQRNANEIHEPKENKAVENPSKTRIKPIRQPADIE